MAAVNCSNVKQREHKPPKLKNESRKRKGLTPLFSYWTLELSDKQEKGLHLGGTHASPRVHLRRGHIRRLESGKHIWVNAHVVGNKENGMVHKDYRLKAPSHATTQTA